MYFRIADWLKAIVFALVIVLAYLFIGNILHTIFLFVVAGFIVFIISPIINFLHRKQVNRGLAIAMTYLLFISILAILIFLIGPVIAEQVRTFIASLPKYISTLRILATDINNRLRQIRFIPLIPINATMLINQAVDIATSQIRNVFSLIPSLIGLITDLFFVLIISIYILIFLPTIDKRIHDALPAELRGKYVDFLTTMRQGLSRYLLGQLAFMLTIGIASGIGVWIVGLPFPALFGFWAGLTEIIPVVGPILGAIPAVIVALTIRPILALYTILVFIIIQQLESQVLGPFILGETVGLNPLLIIFAIVAGGELAGILGVFLAVPTLVVIAVITRFLIDNFEYERVEGGPDRIIVKK